MTALRFVGRYVVWFVFEELYAVPGFISTREQREFSADCFGVIGVLTPGSRGVAAYTQTGARFDPEASQFGVLGQRSFAAILGGYVAPGSTSDWYDPAGRA